MTSVTVTPNPAISGSICTITVTGCTCTRFTINVIRLNVIPPAVVATSGPHSNPPAADMGFMPSDPGNYRVDVVCGDVTDTSQPFTAT